MASPAPGRETHTPSKQAVLSTAESFSGTPAHKATASSVPAASAMPAAGFQATAAGHHTRTSAPSLPPRSGLVGAPAVVRHQSENKYLAPVGGPFPQGLVPGLTHEAQARTALPATTQAPALKQLGPVLGDAGTAPGRSVASVGYAPYGGPISGPQPLGPIPSPPAPSVEARSAVTGNPALPPAPFAVQPGGPGAPVNIRRPTKSDFAGVEDPATRLRIMEAILDPAMSDLDVYVLVKVETALYAQRSEQQRSKQAAWQRNNAANVGYVEPAPPVRPLPAQPESFLVGPEVPAPQVPESHVKVASLGQVEGDITHPSSTPCEAKPPPLGSADAKGPLVREIAEVPPYRFQAASRGDDVVSANTGPHQTGQPRAEPGPGPPRDVFTGTPEGDRGPGPPATVALHGPGQCREGKGVRPLPAAPAAIITTSAALSALPSFHERHQDTPHYESGMVQSYETEPRIYQDPLRTT